LVTNEARKATWSQPVLGLTPAQIAQALQPVSRSGWADEVVEFGRRILLRDSGLVAVGDVVGLLGAALLTGASFAPITLLWLTATLLALQSLVHQPGRLTFRLGDDLGRLLASVGLGALPIAFLAGSAAHRYLTLGMVSCLLVVVNRALTYAGLRQARARGIVSEPAIIVGAGDTGQTLARILADRREFGLSVVGFLDDVPQDGLALLGSLEALETIIAQQHVRHVLVAFGLSAEQKLVRILHSSAGLRVNLHVVPRLFELGVLGGHHAQEDLLGIPLVRVQPPARQAPAWPIKRVVDLGLAIGGIAASTPLLLIAALTVRLSSPGPVFFRQQRVGAAGRPFDVLKFRTMRVNDDSDTTWSVKRDQRVTSVGRLLRNTSIDELPQLFNVLKGDMSLIGPRPERPHFVERFSSEVPRYQERHRAGVGLTGWAQVHGLRGDTSIPDRVRLDNYYIDNWSLWLDVVILFRTALEVVKDAAGR